MTLVEVPVSVTQVTAGRAGTPAPRGLALRARPRYRKLWLAAVISETGDWLLFVALPLYVLQVSGSALATSTVFLAELLPAVVVGMACGPLIDRRNPGRLLAVVTASQAIVLVPLLWLGPGRLWMVYVVAGVQAAATSITTPAQQAVIPSLVEPRELAVANSMLEMAANAARLIGSPLGGLLLPVLGLHSLVACDGASFLVSAVLLAGCGPARSRSAAAPAAGGRARVDAIREGLHAVRHAPTLLCALVVSFVGAVAQGLFLVLFVLFVLRSLHAGADVVGLLRGVQAVGGVLGGVLVGMWSGRVTPRMLTVCGFAGFGVVSLVTWNSAAVTTETWWYAALFVAVGIPATALAGGLLTGVQLASPPHVLGRVLSLTQVAQAVGQGAGIIVAGLLATEVSLAVLLNAQAACYLACAAVALAGFSRPASRPGGTPPASHRR